MPVDLNKVMQQGTEVAKQAKPELWDDNPKTMPDGVKPKPDAPKPVVPTAPKAWDKYQKVIDANEGWDDVVNYSNSLHMMKAVNGRYDKMLSNKELDPAARETIKVLINSSKGAMDELVKISKGTGDPKLFDTYRNNADKAELEMSKRLGAKTNSNYVYDPDTKMIVDRDTFETNNNTVKKADRHSTQTNVGEGGVNTYAGYLQMKGYSDQSRDRVKNQVKPLVTAWTKNAFNLFNSDDKIAGRYDVDNRSSTFNYTVDALKFISKHGTQSGNKELDKKNKENANAYLKQIYAFNSLDDPKIIRDKQMTYIKKLSTSGKTNQITDMVEDMGYYGSTFLYKKYKKTFDNDKYYEGAEKYIGKTQDIDDEIASHELYISQTKEDKLQAKTEALNTSKLPHKKLLYDNIIKDGQIQSYDQFLRNAGYDPKTRVLGKNGRDERTGTVKPPPLYTAYEDLNSFWSGTTGGVVTNVNPNEVHYFGGKDGKKYKEYGTLFQTGDKGAFNDIMRKAYNATVKEYKQRFSLLNDPKKREKDMGSGNTADTVLYYDYVDMSLDKNGRLIKTDGDKATNVAKIFGMLKDADNRVNTSQITLLDNNDLKEGTYSKASNQTLDSDVLKELNQAKYDKFFKGQDLSKMYVEFDRNSSVAGRSTYTFVNMKTGKKLAMIAPFEYIKKNKETFWKETRMSVPEARFIRNGSLNLPDKDGFYKDAAIIQKNGMKYATFKYKDSDGITKQEEIPIGDVQIDIAKQQFLDYFKRLQEIENHYSNL